ncbi:MAG: Gfo/Idh/MocA family oxidoreductase [Neomegalonema sp.]|nr:Gfo/Idh/MocA family oxidoreductase [Neomegalonema sp.]
MTKALASPVRVAIVGAGYFGRFHYDAWSRMPEVELVGMSVRAVEKAADVAAEYGAPGAPLPVFANPAEMATAVRPDIVDITAPPEAHLDIIRAVAPHAPYIICQKPFAGSTQGARQAIAHVAEHGGRIAVHEDIRFQPWNEEAKRLIEGGAVGELYQITFRLRPGDGQGPSAYLDRQPYFQQMPRFLVHETAVHWIDTFRFFMGEASGVFARLAKLNPVIAGEDAGVIYFDFEGGRRGVFDGNRLSDHIAENRRRTLGEMWIEGADGTLRLDGDGRIWLRRFGANQEVEHVFEWRDHLFGGDCVYRCNRAIMLDWLAARASPMEAGSYIRNQVIEDAIYESAESGRYVSV